MKRFYYFHKRANYNICFVSSNFLVEKIILGWKLAKYCSFCPRYYVVLCPKPERTQNLTARLKQQLLAYYFHSPA